MFRPVMAIIRFLHRLRKFYISVWGVLMQRSLRIIPCLLLQNAYIYIYIYIYIYTPIKNSILKMQCGREYYSTLHFENTVFYWLYIYIYILQQHTGYDAQRSLHQHSQNLLNRRRNLMMAITGRNMQFLYLEYNIFLTKLCF